MYPNTCVAEAGVFTVELADEVDVADDLGSQRLDDVDDSLEVAYVQRLGPPRSRAIAAVTSGL